MNLLERIRRNTTDSRRSWPGISIDEYLGYFSYNGNTYPYGLGGQTWGKNEESVRPGYVGLAATAMERNGIVWACNLKRLQIFGEAQYGFQRIRQGVPGEMFTTDALAPLQNPEPNVGTYGLNARLIQDVDLAGNAYRVVRREGGAPHPWLRRVRPDYCKIMFGSTKKYVEGLDPVDLDLEPVMLLHYPDGNLERSWTEAEQYPWEDVMHWAPYPDPNNRWLGMSWITPVVREIQADNKATTHKDKYWSNAATPNLMVKLEIDDVIKFQEWVDEFNRQHQGADNAYKTLFLGAGADPTIIGGNMQQMDFANISGISENRIVMAAGLTATLLGTTEGLQGSSLNAGNYNSSRRSTADTTLANLFTSACEALGRVIEVPPAARLWYFRDLIPFLQEDLADKAKIQQSQAAAIRQLTDAGFKPETVVAAIAADDMSMLQHSGLPSVQVQPAGNADGAGNV